MHIAAENPRLLTMKQSVERDLLYIDWERNHTIAVWCVPRSRRTVLSRTILVTTRTTLHPPSEDCGIKNKEATMKC
jgi:hypothetical protein